MAEQDPKELIFSGITIYYTDKNSTRAKKYFEKACELNDAEKCKKLAEFYFKANDLKKTLEYYSKSCRLNDAKGCYALAALYNEGVAKDEKQMTESLKKACELGLKEAWISSKNKNDGIKFYP
ncbi:hypothetical protein VN0998_03480 [Helicobacter pylori]